MKKVDIDIIENRLKNANRWWYYFEKFMDITLGKIEYTNDDLYELIEYYKIKEQYKLCGKLHKLIK